MVAGFCPPKIEDVPAVLPVFDAPDAKPGGLTPKLVLGKSNVRGTKVVFPVFDVPDDKEPLEPNPDAVESGVGAQGLGKGGIELAGVATLLFPGEVGWGAAMGIRGLDNIADKLVRL